MAQQRTFRKVTVTAVDGDRTSAPIELLQASSGAPITGIIPLVLIDVVDEETGEVVSTKCANREYSLFRNHTKEWLNKRLEGFRVEHKLGAQVMVQLVNDDFFSLEDFNKMEKF